MRNLHRADIQGLRGLAVAAVVLNHTFHEPTGGFLGVDAFFLISGYLITTRLRAEQERTGRIDLLRFWLGRLRRLAPAMMLVTAVTIAAFLTLLPGMQSSLLRDAASALASFANWRFISTGTDYFAAFGPTSPFQHTWSLSVEEQFYAIWPLVFAAVVWCCRRRASGSTEQSRGRSVLSVVLVFVISVSVWLAVSTAVTDPITAYFSTGTRVWELALGALAALASERISLRGRSALVTGWIGVGVLLASFVLVTSDVSAPFPAALGAVSGTAMVLLAGARGAPSPLLLTNPPLRFVGDISYPLYLWHFPLLVLAQVFAPGVTWASIPTAALLAYATTVLVERPVRTIGRGKRSEHPRSRRRTRAVLRAYIALALAPLIAAGALSVQPAPTAPTLPPLSSSSAREVQRVQQRLGTAITATSWPAAGIVAGTPTKTNGTEVRACGQLDARPTIADCTFGSRSATRLAVVVGDSIAGAWLDAVIPAVTADGTWKVIAMPRNGCPFVDTELYGGAGSRCLREQDRVLETVERLHPDAVLLSSRIEGKFALRGGAVLASDDEIIGMHRRLLDRLIPLTDRTVVLAAPPTGADLDACPTRFGSPVACLAPLGAQWQKRSRALHQMVEERGSSFIDSSPLVARHGITPSFVGRFALRTDTAHLDPAFSRTLAPAIAELLSDTLEHPAAALPAERR